MFRTLRVISSEISPSPVRVFERRFFKQRNEEDFFFLLHEIYFFSLTENFRSDILQGRVQEQRYRDGVDQKCRPSGEQQRAKRERIGSLSWESFPRHQIR